MLTLNYKDIFGRACPCVPTFRQNRARSSEAPAVQAVHTTSHYESNDCFAPQAFGAHSRVPRSHTPSYASGAPYARSQAAGTAPQNRRGSAGRPPRRSRPRKKIPTESIRREILFRRQTGKRSGVGRGRPEEGASGTGRSVRGLVGRPERPFGTGRSIRGGRGSPTPRPPRRARRPNRHSPPLRVGSNRPPSGPPGCGRHWGSCRIWRRTRGRDTSGW